jgi:hypothetical protein
MSADDKVVVPLYSYREFLKSSGFSQDTVDAVREEVANHEIIPKYITNGQVCQYPSIHEQHKLDNREKIRP